jgi:hypothetical protein
MLNNQEFIGFVREAVYGEENRFDVTISPIDDKKYLILDAEGKKTKEEFRKNQKEIKHSFIAILKRTKNFFLVPEIVKLIDSEN